jgi:hypothetical protein
MFVHDESSLSELIKPLQFMSFKIEVRAMNHSTRLVADL